MFGKKCHTSSKKWKKYKNERTKGLAACSVKPDSQQLSNNFVRFFIH